MQDRYQFREGAPGDASALAALSIEVWLNTYADEGVSKAYGDHLITTFTKEAFLAGIDDQNTRIIVCHRGTFLLGYVKVLLSAEPPIPDCGTAEIAALYVRGHHKGAGIGTALLEKAIVVARDQGHAAVFLTVNHKNLPAIAFYEARGMTRRGEWNYKFQNITVMNYLYATQTAEPG